MEIELLNDGPVTLLIETPRANGPPVKPLAGTE